MKKLILSFICFTFLTACIDENPTLSSPKTPISPKEFQYLIKEIWLMNAHIYNNKKYTLLPKDSIGHATLEILNKKGFDKNDLSQAIKFYTSKPAFLDSLIRDLRDSLENSQIKISHDETEEYYEINSDSMINILEKYPKFNSIDINESFNFIKSTRDSIIEYFKKNQGKLGNYSFEQFASKIADTIKN